MANPERFFLNPRFLSSKTGRIIGAGVVAIGSTLTALPLFDHDLTQAEVKAEVKSAQPGPAKKEAAEILQISQYTIEFDLDGDHYYWDISNGTWGIYPPNDPNRDIGTVRVVKNYDFINFTSFQPLGSLYAEETQRGPGVGITIGGMAVNTKLDKYYLGTATTRNDGYLDPSFELGSGLKTPEQYTNRIRVKKGLPTGGVRGLETSRYIILGADASGNYANYIFNACLDSTENGTYQVRLDNVGNPIGDTFVKLHNVFLPIITRNQ